MKSILMADPPILPTTALIKYLNEGAANVVYRILIPPPTPEPTVLEDFESDTPPPTEYQTLPSTRLDPSIFESTFFSSLKSQKAFVSNHLDSANCPLDKLLRLRKALPTTIPTLHAQTNWSQLITPLFTPSQLVAQSLVLIPPTLISELNTHLISLETSSHRLTKRHGIYLAHDPYGLLITDMTPHSATEKTIEFKPKWLLQSHFAPRDAVRCRQCAQNALKNSRVPEREKCPLYCPLDFFSKDHKTVNILAGQLLDSKLNPEMQKRLAEWIINNPLLPKLRGLQENLERRSITAWRTESGPELEALCALMTLRDCTIFLRFRDGVEKIEARIGDLDLKNPAKLKYWREVQEELVESGWYQGREAEGKKQPTICALSRGQ